MASSAQHSLGLLESICRNGHWLPHSLVTNVREKLVQKHLYYAAHFCTSPGGIYCRFCALPSHFFRFTTVYLFSILAFFLGVPPKFHSIHFGVRSSASTPFFVPQIRGNRSYPSRINQDCFYAFLPHFMSKIK